MPQVSDFYGITIFMNFNDHVPPHFHAWYNHGEYKVMVDISTGTIKGEMPGRALRMILEWLDIHRAELLEAWERTCRGVNPGKIAPLH
ncbi:MAG: DUF4160 domain-containing protein [Bacteroidales bacterium]|nr:DUF4160 domain-containing protein [Bacteroidales bacterium]